MPMEQDPDVKDTTEEREPNTATTEEREPNTATTENEPPPPTDEIDDGCGKKPGQP